jgi:FkbM family methyltransferase
MAYYAYESREIAALRRIVKRGDIVADVGANVGYMTAHFAEMVGRNGKVFAFEPGPTALGVLRETAESCLYRNIQVVASAVSNRNGVAKFFETDAALSKGFSRIDLRPSNRHTSTEIAIPVTRLDSFFATLDARRLSLVKIDAEGHERQCIEGLVGVLAEGRRPALMTEATGNEEGIAEFFRITALLKPFGYVSLDLSFKPMDARALGPNFHGNVLWTSSSPLDHREALRASQTAVNP